MRKQTGLVRLLLALLLVIIVLIPNGSRVVPSVEAQSDAVVVDPTTLTIGEPGGSGSITFTLTSEPTDTVSIPLSAPNGQCTVPSSPVTLDAGNWDTGATATVTAFDDDIDDGSQICIVETGPTDSNDANYDEQDPADVTVTVQDDDQAGFTVTPSTLTIGEPNGSGTFTLKLTSEPTDPVSIPLSAPNGQCEVSDSSVILNPGNWDTGVTATVTAFDDDIDDGSQTCVVQTGPATSDDSNYDDRNPGDVTVTVDDDDEAGIDIDPTTLTISEPNGSGTFTVRLDSQPTGSVLFPLTTSNNQCSISRSHLWLTPSNWATGVTTVVSAVDDSIDDGRQTCIVETGVTESDDGNYDNIDPLDVTVRVDDDDDEVDITVTPTTMSIDEPSGSGTFIVSLTAAPTAMVSIPLSAPNGQCTVSPTTLNLHPWATSATATVTAVDDDIDDGTQTCEVVTGEAQSDDGGYDGIDPADVTVYVGDDDGAGTIVDPTTLSVSEPLGYSTFTVFLTSEPTADVSIPLLPSNSQCEVWPASPDSLTLSPANWDTGATAIVYAVDDDIDDGTQTCQIQTQPATSADSNYAGRNPADVTVTVGDDDGAGFTVTPATLTMAEPNGSGTFTIRLTSEPTDPVSIPLSRSNSQCQVPPTPLTLDASNWDSGATATVSAVDDDIDDGTQTCVVVTQPAQSNDDNYDGLNPNNVTVTVTDDDEVGISVTPTSLSVNEPDGSGTFTIRLTSEPTANVDIDLWRSNDECRVSPTTLTLNATNWDEGATATVFASDDDIDDGTQTCVVVTLPAESNDDNYDGLNPDNVTATVIDDDRADIAVVPTTLVVSEPDDSDTFTIRLTSEPTANVDIDLSASNNQCTVSSSVTLNATNWDTGATATVTAVDDEIADGTQICQVETGDADSADPSYDGRNPVDVTIVVGDDDAPSIIVAPISLTVSEPNGSDTFVVSLSSRPAYSVEIPLSPSNDECEVDYGIVTLNEDNWGTGATVTVSAVDDDLDDDDQICIVQTEPANSNDLHYNGLDAANVTVIVEDDETLLYLPAIMSSWPPFPGVPTLEPISNPGGDGIYTVNWIPAPHSEPETYILEEDTDSTFANATEAYVGTSTSYVVLDRGASRYYYRVKSRNAWGDSKWSGVQQVDVLWEAEPNDQYTEANGPLVSGPTYYGTFLSSADHQDYFYIELDSPHYIEVWLANIPYLQDYDLVLRNSNLNVEGYSAQLGNLSEHIRTNPLPAGTYYVQVFRASQGGSTQPYHLRVVFE